LNAISLRGAGLGRSRTLARSLVAVIKEVKPETTPEKCNYCVIALYWNGSVG